VQFATEALAAIEKAKGKQEALFEEQVEKIKTWAKEQIDGFFNGDTLFIPQEAPVFNSTQNGNPKEWVKQEGTAYPDTKVSLVVGGSVGYIHNFSGHVFVGVDISVFRPLSPVVYKLEVEKDKKGEVAETDYGKVAVKIHMNVNPALIIGKEFNPYTSVYGKIGGMFTNVGLTYMVKDENPPFMKKDHTGFESARTMTHPTEKESPIWLKGASLGLGVMFVNGNWLWALEYNFSLSKKEEIRKYGTTEDDPHIRGYMYAHTDHRLMLRVMYMKRL